MSDRLSPKNKNLDDFIMIGASWKTLLHSGVGLAVGFASGLKPTSFIFKPDRCGRDPLNDSGYEVTAKQAKLIAYLTRQYVDAQKILVADWRRLPEEEQKRFEDLYNIPIREDFIEVYEKFIDWADQSRGFFVK